MPAVSVTAMTTLSGQSFGASSSRPCHSGPSRVTKPPNTERAADADAWRAASERSAALMPRPKAASRAVTSAANPDADDASPAAVGKSLAVCTSTGGTEYRWRSRARQPAILASAVSRPFRWKRSAAASRTSVVVVRVSRVTDREGAAGTLPAPGAFPQYLIRAMFGWA